VNTLGPSVPFWALELTDHLVTAVRVRRSADGAMEILAWWSAPVIDGENPLAAAVRQVHRRGLREHGIHLVLPGRGATCRSSRISPEDADLSPGELERDLYDFTPFDPPEAVLRARRLGGAGVLDFRVVAERRAEIGRVEQAFEAAGCAHLGISLSPAALLAAREALLPAATRGYVLAVRGAWSSVTAFDGALSVRYPIPFGMNDLRRRYEAASPPVPFAEALVGTGEASVKALAAAADPLAIDLRRSIDFHRAAVRATGEEILLFAGAGAERAGLRAAIASLSPVAFAAPVAIGPPGPLRAGPRVRPEDLAAALPGLLGPVGACLGSLGITPRDLDFRNLPDDLPAPPERNLYPVATAALVLGLAGSFLLATATRDTLARGAAAVDALPPRPEPTALTAEAGREKAGTLTGLADRALRRSAFRRSLASILEVAPRGGGAEEIHLQSLGDGYRSRVRIRPAADAAAPGWTVVERKDGGVILERVER
jgi:hypothetical protein